MSLLYDAEKPLLAVDTETTGVDRAHGAKPYLLTTCDEDGLNVWWQWEVDPLTREPLVSEKDKQQIKSMLARYRLVMQNPKFDVGMIQTIIPDFDPDWSTLVDTLMASHLLESDKPKDLTSLAKRWLGVNVEQYEEGIRKASLKARDYCRRNLPDWRIARAGLPEMPSAKQTVWKYDMWLPEALDKHLGTDNAAGLVAKYANCDSTITLHIARRQLKALADRGLDPIYRERLKLLPVIHGMEKRGVTVNRDRLRELVGVFSAETERAGKRCVAIAEHVGAQLQLPKSGNNASLLKAVFGWRAYTCDDCGRTFDKRLGESLGTCPRCKPPVGRLRCENRKGLGLAPVAVSKKTGDPSLDKKALEHYLAVLPERGFKFKFVEALQAKRKRDTALSYMESYERFWIPWRGSKRWYQLYPSLNATGTNTLRFSSQNPNEQNISKQEGFNLRYCFGPGPGREWWSLDANNIELRLPAYEAGEEEMLQIFERPDDPPYYGSNHLLVFDILYPDLFAKHGAKVKKLFASTKYQWTKNGNFAVQYGAVEESGTADAAYHYPGAQRRIKARFKRIAALNQKMIDFGQRNGYVETMPDRTVDPTRGYPLRVPFNRWGRVKPTVPLNYHVQGTAMWWMSKAMVRCQTLLDHWNEEVGEPTYFMVMQVHDELVFDFPHAPNQGNRKRIMAIARAMEQGGNDIGVPTPVGIDYHPNNWSESE